MAVAVFLVTLLLMFCIHGWGYMKRQWKENILIGLVAVMAGWIGLYGWSVILTVYQDHEQFVSTNKSIGDENSKMKQENKDLRDHPQTVTKIVTNTIPGKPVVVQPQDLPVRIVTKEYGAVKINVDGKSGTTYVILGIINRTISPVRAVLTCDEDFVVFPPYFVLSKSDPTTAVSGLHVARINNRTFEYRADQPAWAPDQPLGFNVFTEASSINCAIDQNP